MEYLNHLDQSLPVFNLTVIIGKSGISTRIESTNRKLLIILFYQSTFLKTIISSAEKTFKNIVGHTPRLKREIVFN